MGIEGVYKSVEGKLVRLEEGEEIDPSEPVYFVSAKADPGAAPADLSGWTEIGFTEDTPPAFGPPE